jgi:hypothetical protein
MLFSDVYDSPAPIRSAMADKWWHEDCQGELDANTLHVLLEAEGMRRRILAARVLEGRAAA